MGWDLHLADRVREDGAERVLQYLPLRIYLHFEDATWVIDSRLGPGVWPLFPVERTWTLNEALGTMNRRKGLHVVAGLREHRLHDARRHVASRNCGMWRHRGLWRPF